MGGWGGVGVFVTCTWGTASSTFQHLGFFIKKMRCWINIVDFNNCFHMIQKRLAIFCGCERSRFSWDLDKIQIKFNRHLYHYHHLHHYCQLYRYHQIPVMLLPPFLQYPHSSDNTRAKSYLDSSDAQFRKLAVSSSNRSSSSTECERATIRGLKHQVIWCWCWCWCWCCWCQCWW